MISPNQQLETNRINNIIKIQSKFIDGSSQFNLYTEINLDYHYHIIFSKYYEDIGDIINELSDYDNSFIYICENPISGLDCHNMEEYFRDESSIQVDSLELQDQFISIDEIILNKRNDISFLWGIGYDSIEELTRLDSEPEGHSFIILFDDNLDKILKITDNIKFSIDLCKWLIH